MHFIVDEKVKILHFCDEDKSWWSSILCHSENNDNCHLYIFVLMLLQLVIDCFEQKTFIPLIFNWFLLLFTTNIFYEAKKVLIFPTGIGSFWQNWQNLFFGGTNGTSGKKNIWKEQTLAALCPHFVFECCRKKLLSLPQPSVIDTRQARKA